MSTGGAPKVLAVVLNYNLREITVEAIASLRRMTYPNVSILHVDNGSTDGSAEAVEAAFSDVETLRLEENQGPVRGLNAGMKAAFASDAEYFLFLNNDIEVDPEMLSELVEVAESSPEIGAVGPKAFYFDDRNRLWSAGGILQFKESPTRERGMGEVDSGQYDRVEEVDYINGCAMLLRREAAEGAGYWDPMFEFAGEDADFCMRIKNNGYRCVYTPRALLWHMVSHTSGRYEPRRTRHTGRSTAIFVRRYGRLAAWLSFFTFMPAALLVAFFRELPSGNHRAVLAKARGALAGLFAPISPPPGPDTPAEALGLAERG